LIVLKTIYKIIIKTLKILILNIIVDIVENYFALFDLDTRIAEEYLLERKYLKNE